MGIIHGDTILPCTKVDPNLFFPLTPQQLKEAQAVCETCPLKVECLIEALQRREMCGVWGGQHIVDGKITMRGFSVVGRPKKSPLTVGMPKREPMRSRSRATIKIAGSGKRANRGYRSPQL